MKARNPLDDINIELLSAVIEGDAKTVKTLLENGANPNQPLDGLAPLLWDKTTTLLQYAYFKNMEHIVFLLARFGAKEDEKNLHTSLLSRFLNSDGHGRLGVEKARLAGISLYKGNKQEKKGHYLNAKYLYEEANKHMHSLYGYHDLLSDDAMMAKEALDTLFKTLQTKIIELTQEINKQHAKNRQLEAAIAQKDATINGYKDNLLSYASTLEINPEETAKTVATNSSEEASGIPIKSIVNFAKHMTSFFYQQTQEVQEAQDQSTLQQTPTSSPPASPR